MKKHVLKCRQPFFDLAWFKRKPVEIRFNDRDFQPGDEIVLVEYRLMNPEEIESTFRSHFVIGKRSITNKVREVYTGLDGLTPGYAFLVLDQIKFSTLITDPLLPDRGNIHDCPAEHHTPPQAGLPLGDIES